MFIDFEKAFDSVNREAMWKEVKGYGIPRHLIDLIKETYRGYMCRLVHEDCVSEPFPVTAGVRQGCILSPLMFLVVIDAVMHNVNRDRRRGIRWGLVDRLEDLDFADDLCLLSEAHSEMQTKLGDLTKEAGKVGLAINIKKTKALRVNTTKKEPFMLGNESIEDVESFVYLGSKVTKDGGTTQDVAQRIQKANGAFVQLYPVWRNNNISTKTKLRIFRSNVKSVLLYGSETWRVAKTTISKLQVFVNRCLRRILNIHWPEVIPNEELWRKTEETEISIQIKRRKWNWIGHTLRKGQDTIERGVLDWNPQGQRKRGRPRQTWRRSVHREALEEGKSWGEVKQLARNRIRWRRFVDALCP